MPLGGSVHAAVFMSWAAPVDLGGAQSEARAETQPNGDGDFSPALTPKKGSSPSVSSFTSPLGARNLGSGPLHAADRLDVEPSDPCELTDAFLQAFG